VAPPLATTAKQDVAALTEHCERRLDALFLPASRRLGEAAAAGGAGPMTHDRRREVLRAADAVLDALYGRVRGAPSPVATTVTTHAELAFAAPVAREAARLADLLRRRHETVLLAALLAEA